MILRQPDQAKPVRSEGRKHSAFGWSLAISLALLAYLFSQIKLADLLKAFQGIFWPSLTMYFICNLLAVGLRSYRYWLLTIPRQIGLGSFVLVTLVRNLFVDLLPAKLGSLSYIYVLVRRFRLPLELAASSFILVAFFDTLALAPLLMIAIVMVGLGRSPLATPLLLALSFVWLLVLSLLLSYLDRLLDWLVCLVEKITGWLKWRNSKMISWLDTKIQLISSNIHLIKRERLYFKTFVISLGVRALKYISLYFLTHAFLSQFGYSLNQLNFWVVLLGIAGAELSTLMPIQGLAGLGTWEAAWTLVFVLLGFDPKLAIITGLGVHLTTQIFEYTLGIISLLVLAIPVSE